MMTGQPRDLLAALVGRPIPGPCDHCQAVQRITRQPKGRMVFQTIHAPDCLRRTS